MPDPIDPDADDDDDSIGEQLVESLGPALERLRARATSRSAKESYALLAAVVVVVGVFWLSWTLAGPIATILYAFLFVFFATLVPSAIGIMGGAVPLAGSLGKGHVILGAIAFGSHYLVQRDDAWEWCPGEGDRVYIDGEWHDIEGGFEHRSILGWRPFGILRFKTDDTLQDVRADTRAEKERDSGVDAVGSVADGGAVERAGFTEDDGPAVTGDDGTWVLDLKRLYAGGVRKIGDSELIEKAEEVIERGEMASSRTSGWEPIVATAVGLVIGFATGYVVLIGF